MKKIVSKLLDNQDLKYKSFTFSLISDISESNIIGVKIPVIRKIAKNMNSEDISIFLKELPHNYFEENILHSVLISNIKDIDLCILELDKFLDYVDNWSVCDTLICKILSSDLEKTFSFLESCLESKSVYRVRFAFVCMLRHFINDEYIDMCNNICVNYKSDEYYINMAIAWYFSYALIFQYDKTISIFENKLLDKWVHNKSIQKAIESYRISDDRKNYLKSLRIK